MGGGPSRPLRFLLRSGCSGKIPLRDYLLDLLEPLSRERLCGKDALRDNGLEVLQVRPDLRRSAIVPRRLPLGRFRRGAIAHFVNGEILRVTLDGLVTA